MKYRLFLVATIAPLMGCADMSTSPLRTPSQPDAFGVYGLDYPDSVLAFSGLERAFLQLEKEVPGFAGFYRENGSLVLLSTLEPNETFGRSVSEKLATGRRSGLVEKASISEREIIRRVERVLFRFRDLAFWRSRIRNGVMDLPGVTTLDLDEAANRIVVGVEPNADRGRLTQYLASAEVPEAAVEFKLDPEPQTAQSVHSRIRPLTAGTRVGTYNQYFGPPDWTPRWSRNKFCTLGQPALYQGAQTILQVSHCTNLEGILENPAINYYTYFIGQDWYPDLHLFIGWGSPAPQGYNPFGYEQFDRRGPTCGPFWDSRPCRHAEVAVWNISGMEVIQPEVPFVLGRIAKTEFSLPGTAPNGNSFILHPTQPYFTIVGEVVNPVQFDEVQKVGVTTGWTMGFVYSTCTDINYQTLGNIKRRVWCYDRADLGGNEGDSGSPVFRIVDSAAGLVYFYGLVSLRGDDRPGSTAFGSVRQIRGEIGAFQVF